MKIFSIPSLFLSLCLSMPFIQPIHSEELCDSNYAASSKASRLETTLKIDLSYNTEEGAPAFIEWMILPSDQVVQLLLPEEILLISAQELMVDDVVLMANDDIGLITFVDTKQYTPQSHSADVNGQGYRRVLAKSKRLTNTLLLIHTQGETLETTPEHPFYVEGQWVEAQELKVGDRIKSVRTKPVVVEDIELKNDTQFVHNLKVEGEENFYVGKNGLLAHNCVLGPAGELTSVCNDPSCGFNPRPLSDMTPNDRSFEIGYLEDSTEDIGKIIEDLGANEGLSPSSITDREIGDFIEHAETKRLNLNKNRRKAYKKNRTHQRRLANIRGARYSALKKSRKLQGEKKAHEKTSPF